MKKGFTLAELLIGLGIVGVVAALAGPAIIGFMPDKVKSSYIKTYNVVSNKVQDIISDPELYWQDGGACKGIGCTQKPQELLTEANYTQVRKLPMLLYNRLNASTGITFNNNESKFTTMDGAVWTFNVSNVTPAGFTHTLSVDFKGGSGCTYNVLHCKKPTKFTFKIENSGNVVATDAMGMAYLRNALDLRFTDQDKQLAQNILSDAVSKKNFSEEQLAKFEAEYVQMVDKVKF